MGHEPRASTLDTQNSVLNRVLDAVVARDSMNRTHVPILITNAGTANAGQTFAVKSIAK